MHRRCTITASITIEITRIINKKTKILNIIALSLCRMSKKHKNSTKELKRQADGDFHNNTQLYFD